MGQRKFRQIVSAEFNFGELWPLKLHRWPITSCLDRANLWGNREPENGFSYCINLLHHPLSTSSVCFTNEEWFAKRRQWYNYIFRINCEPVLKRAKYNTAAGYECTAVLCLKLHCVCVHSCVLLCLHLCVPLGANEMMTPVLNEQDHQSLTICCCQIQSQGERSRRDLSQGMWVISGLKCGQGDDTEWATLSRE